MGIKLRIIVENNSPGIRWRIRKAKACWNCEKKLEIDFQKALPQESR